MALDAMTSRVARALASCCLPFAIAACDGTGAAPGGPLATPPGASPVADGGTPVLSPATAPDPVAKYAGIYTGCSDNARTTVTITVAEGGALNGALREDVYAQADCTGALLGSFEWRLPFVARFTAAEASRVWLWEAASDEQRVVDRFSVVLPAQASVPVGPAVVGECLVQPNLRVCHEATGEDRTVERALLLEGASLSILEPTGATYEAEGPALRRAD
jgi:hypothetical protein